MDTNWEYYGANDGYSQGGGYYGTSPYNSLITSKDEWAGISPERAYSEDVPWSFKRQAQIKYLAMLKQSRHALIKNTACEMAENGKWRAEPQISAFYSSFPWPARASVGHTVFVEASDLKKTVIEIICRHLCNPLKVEACQRDRQAYLVAAYVTKESLGNRIMLDELGMQPDLANVEFYRLFQAAHNTLRFSRLSDVINGVVLLGDILPQPRLMNLHPLTEKMMISLIKTSQRWWMEAAQNPGGIDLEIYLRWGDAIMNTVQQFLPPKQKEKAGQEEQKNSKREVVTQNGEQSYITNACNQPEMQNHMPPLAEPQPPQLDQFNAPFSDLPRFIRRRKGLDELDDLLSDFEDEPHKEKPSSAQQALSDMMQVAGEASSQRSDWEDMREDIVEQSLMNRPFQEGPIQGEVTNGTSITREIGGKEVGGELFDRNVPLCENMEQIEALRQQAAPVSNALKRNLYPSIHEEFKTEYPRASGQLDAKRLPLAEFSDAVYRRFLVEEELDPNGRAVLLIAADASASLSDDQMQMCKCLMAGWLDSVPSSNIQVMAAFYHSDCLRSQKGPLVQWVYHPDKTPVYTSREAVRAVANLPNSGSGAQSDALSLIYLFDEARAISRGACVYVTLISDCAFNRSFVGTETSSSEEVAEVIKEGRKQFDEKLHVTLVALGRGVPEIVQEEVDAVIPVNQEDLRNPENVAETVGGYVANCISSRRKKIKKIY